MKKQLILCTVLCLMLNIPAFSNSERGYINSNAIVEKELSPDTVELSVAVVTYDAKSLQTASAENKMLSDKIYNALNEMIDNNNGDYVKTSNYNAQPIYVYVNGKRNFEKYQVSNRVVVHTKNIKQTGNFIDKAIQLGATNVDSIRFSFHLMRLGGNLCLICFRSFLPFRLLLLQRELPLLRERLPREHRTCGRCA